MKTLIKLITIICIFFINNVAVFSNDKINVVYTIDNNYPIFTLISINSILLNNSSNSNYKFYIIEDNLSAKNQNLMEKFVKKRNQEIEFIEINSPIITKNPNAYLQINRITPIALARIFIPDLLPDSENRALYIDADTVTISDIKELYTTNLENKIAGMVLNTTQVVPSQKLYKFKNGYFNSGVILIDLEKARKDNSSKKFSTYYTNNYEKFVPKTKKTRNIFPFPDQDLINIVWDGKIKKLENKWNQQQIKVSNKGIIHYIGQHKPWLFTDIKNNSRKDYLSTWKQTPELEKYRYLYLTKAICKQYKQIAKKKIKHHKETLLFLLFNKY